MKTIEEKAKAYDEAIQRMKGYVIDEFGCTRLKPSDIFPELAESEDEKIRKAILKHFREYEPTCYFNGCFVKDILAWLEKQGEKKSNKCMYSKDNYTDEDRKVLCDGCEEDCKLKQMPAQWSEEDEVAINMAIIALEDMYSENEPETTYAGFSLPFDKAASRLKSLRPQKKWKPSEEHLQGMRRAICKADKGSDAERDLKDLYEQLKAL